MKTQTVVFLLMLFCLLVFSNAFLANAQNSTNQTANKTAQAKNISFIDAGSFPASEENTTVRFVASFVENSTGLFKIIPDAACSIAFSGEAVVKKMAFNPDVGYEFVKQFTETANIGYTVNCTHPKYADKTIYKTAQIIVDRTEVFLLQPGYTVSTRDVDFVCEARGTRPDSISLYTDTSGKWDRRASANITGGRSPFRVNFKEHDVADGSYSWNCVAGTEKGPVSSVSNKSFRVKFSPVASNCTESADCGSWGPDPCPSEQVLTRFCNKTILCGYKTSKQCSSVKGVNISGNGGEAIQTLSPDSSGNSKTAGSSGGGLGIIPIFLVILIIAGGIAFYFLKIRKKKPEKEEDIFGNEGLEDEDFGDGKDPESDDKSGGEGI